MIINRKDLLAFRRSNDIMMKNPNELNEVLYKYMEAYVNNDDSLILYLDEIENLINIRNHEEIIELILNKK